MARHPPPPRAQQRPPGHGRHHRHGRAGAQHRLEPDPLRRGARDEGRRRSQGDGGAVRRSRRRERVRQGVRSRRRRRHSRALSNAVSLSTRIDSFPSPAKFLECVF